MGLQEGKFAYKAVTPHNDEEKETVKKISSIDEKEASEASWLIPDRRASTWQAVANMTSFVQGVGTLALPYAVFKRPRNHSWFSFVRFNSLVHR